MLQKHNTTSLFYNKYLYKLRIKNEIGAIFRGMNLSHAKQKIDDMQSHAETQQNILPVLGDKGFQFYASS